MKKFSSLSIIGFGLFLFLSGPVWAVSYTVQVATSGDMHYLVDSKGDSLYYYTKDVVGGSVCTGGCLNAWPVFYTDKITVPAELSAADFGTLTRSDGTKQTTYKGWALYYFARDTKPGDITGENVGKAWFVMKVPYYTVMLGTSSTLGNYLTDAKGMTLYYYTKDTADTSVCTGNCIQNWPAFYASHIVAPTGVNPADFGTITRDDGTMQTTYKGNPLYYWIRDTKPGDTTGEAVGNIWYVVDPEKLQRPQM